jgi:hypothetical protein
MPGAPRTIEIVGVAGSGKSTLTRAMSTGYGCHVADSLHTRMPAHWPYVVRSLPQLLRFASASARDRPVLSWDELKFVIYVEEWARFLRAEERTRTGVTVLDQGPVFALACLLWGQKPVTRHAPFEHWLLSMIERWSLELDAIVVLDAPDDVLLARIDEREQRHDVKGVSAHEALEVIGRHRDAYGRVLGLSERLGSTRTLRYDTATMPSAQVAAELAEVFELTRVRELTEAPRARNLIQGSATTREDA